MIPTFAFWLTACGLGIDTFPQAPSGVELPCGGADLGKMRIQIAPGFPGATFVLESADDGAIFGVRWPAGFSAEQTDEGPVLLDPGGSIVAREGDLLRIGGGHGSSNTVEVCEINGTVYSTAPFSVRHEV